VALALLTLPAGVVVVVAWAWLTAATDSQSLIRQLMYWWSILVVPGARPLILSQDKELTAQLETGPDMAGPLASRLPFDVSGYRLITRSVSMFQPDRLLYDCIAVKLRAPAGASGGAPGTAGGTPGAFSASPKK